MVVITFRSRLRDEFLDKYNETALKMLALAREMPGFISFKSYTADDGERISVIEFETEEHVTAWRNHPEHRTAQQLGRDKFYAEYHLSVSKTLRSYSFEYGG